MTQLLPVLNFTGEMSKLLIDGSEYEKLLDMDLKEFTNDLKNLTSERLPKVSKTRCKHHDLVYGAGLSHKGRKKEIALLNESIQTIKSLKEQYPMLLEKGLVKFPTPCDSLVSKAMKELFETYLNFINTMSLPTEGTLQPFVDTLGSFKDARGKFTMEYVKALMNKTT